MLVRGIYSGCVGDQEVVVLAVWIMIVPVMMVAVILVNTLLVVLIDIGNAEVLVMGGNGSVG